MSLGVGTSLTLTCSASLVESTAGKKIFHSRNQSKYVIFIEPLGQLLLSRNNLFHCTWDLKLSCGIGETTLDEGMVQGVIAIYLSSP